MEKKKALEKKSLPSSKHAQGGAARGGDEDQLDFGEGEDEEEEEEEASKDGKGGAGWAAGEEDDETDKEKARRKAIKERAREYESLREELKAKHRAARVMTGAERAKYDAVSY